MAESTGEKCCMRRRRLMTGAAAFLASPYAAVGRSLSNRDPRRLRLEDFGGVPGASFRKIVRAFEKAFAELKTMGSGTLVVSPGVYHVGRFGQGTAIEVDGLRDVLIWAYGARLTLRTTRKATPVFLKFNNPHNITIAGLGFYDAGADLEEHWRGAVCLAVYASNPRSGFKTVDCVADNVCTFLQSQQRDESFRFTGFDIGAKISNAYYGVNVNWNGRFSRCDIKCLNVRRAVLMQAARDWDINVTTHRTHCPGSNAHVVLDTFADGPVKDTVVNITASGALNGYAAIGSICHQPEDGVYSYARNVRFNVSLKNVISPAATGVVSFTAEPESGGGIRPSTVGAYEEIEVRGSVSGDYDGRFVANPSVSKATTNSIRIGRNLAAYQDMDELPDYFHIDRQDEKQRTPRDEDRQRILRKRPA